jgi:Na+/proline symporter
MTLAGALAGMITGAAVVILWINLGWDGVVYELLPGFAAATLAILIVSLATKPPEMETAHG